MIGRLTHPILARAAWDSAPPSVPDCFEKSSSSGGLMGRAISPQDLDDEQSVRAWMMYGVIKSGLKGTRFNKKSKLCIRPI